jgi:hypothetical protein
VTPFTGLPTGTQYLRQLGVQYNEALIGDVRHNRPASSRVLNGGCDEVDHDLKEPSLYWNHFDVNQTERRCCERTMTCLRSRTARTRKQMQGTASNRIL